ncbi:MAG: hypothetical protein IKV68_05865 [Oscillospiraceae bacterium]|nr:hypothetical protein [Oscillospiraceae bacterium]
MLGWICWQKGASVHAEICGVSGVTFYRLTAAPPRFFRQRRKLLQHIRAMRQRGIRCVVVQGEGDNELLWQQGLLAVDAAPLRLALLPKLLDYAETVWQLSLSAAAVRLRSKTVDRTVYQAAQILAQRTRYLELSVETGREELEDWLRRCYGLGAGGGETVLEVCVGVEESGALPALHLGKGCGERQSLQLFCETLTWADEQMLAALFQAEKLETNAVVIKSVGFRA